SAGVIQTIDMTEGVGAMVDERRANAHYARGLTLLLHHGHSPMPSSSICARIVTLLALGLQISACATSDNAASDPNSLLVGRILLAEDGRDASDSALVQGEAHADPVIRALAVRARERIA